jgi:hypothetical protein
LREHNSGEQFAAFEGEVSIEVWGTPRDISISYNLKKKLLNPWLPVV